MMRSACILFVMLLAHRAMAQPRPVQLGTAASDCRGALMLNDTVVGPVFSPKGYGEKLEIEGYELGDPYFIEREHNTVWYRFIVPFDAVLTFDIIPNRLDDDFDFMLFQYDGPNFCQLIADGQKLPVRTNISRKNIQVNGRTGLSESSVYEFVPSGPGSSYSRPLKVHKGAMYYLLVDNPFRENEGHTIQLHYKKLAPAVIAENKAAEERDRNTEKRQLVITVKDKSNGQRIPANIFVEGLPDSLANRFPVVSQVNLTVTSYRTYEINAVRKGYLLSNQTFIPKNDSLYEVEVMLEPMKVGDRINLENIKFEGDRTVILETSLNSLGQLKEFLEVNPSVQVDIQGHVNGEGKKNKKPFIRLSEERAQAIYEKLIEGGISASRLTYKGFGNSGMIYPTPVNNRQSEANRRVEIEILSL